VVLFYYRWLNSLDWWLPVVDCVVVDLLDRAILRLEYNRETATRSIHWVLKIIRTIPSKANSYQ